MDELVMVWDGDFWQIQGPFKTHEEAEEEKRLWLKGGIFNESDLAIIPNDGRELKKFKPIDPAEW